MNKVLNDQRASLRLFFMCWIAYATSYLGRMNYSTSLANMISETSMTKSQAGMIGTAFFYVMV